MLCTFLSLVRNSCSLVGYLVELKTSVTIENLLSVLLLKNCRKLISISFSLCFHVFYEMPKRKLNKRGQSCLCRTTGRLSAEEAKISCW